MRDIFARGNRLLSACSVLLILEAVAHTVGTLSPLPDDPKIQSVTAAMRDLRLPLGLGMEPSAFDINRGLGLTMSVALVLMGIVGLTIPAAAPGDTRVYHATAWILCGTNFAMLTIWWVYRVPPPLVFHSVLTPLLLLSALLPRPARREP